VSLVRGYIMGATSDHILFSLKRYLTPFFFFYVFANNINNKKQIEYIYVTVAFVTVIPAIMALKESYIDIGSFGSWDSMRVGGITQQPNDLAAYFSYYTPFVLAPFLHNMKKPRYWLLVLGTFLCFWATTRTFSRGGMIAIIFSIFLTIVLTHKKIAFGGVALLVVVLLFFPFLLPSSIIGRFAATFHPLQKKQVFVSRKKSSIEDELDPNRLDKSAAKRVDVWMRAVPHIIRNPIFGIGYARFIHLFQLDAHNGYVLIATEMGLPALFIYLVILWRLAKSAWYLFKNSPCPLIKMLGHAYVCCIVAVCVANLFGSRLNSQELSSSFWILGGIVVMVERKMRSRNNPEFETIEEEKAERVLVDGQI
jgi:O-antigen ligase